MGMSGQRHAPAALYSSGGPQSWSGYRGYRKNPMPLPGIEPRSPGCPVCTQDTIPTELPQFHPRYSLPVNKFDDDHVSKHHAILLATLRGSE
jgi:hypothetical protein